MEPALFAFEIPLDTLLRYLEQVTGQPIDPETLIPEPGPNNRPVDWHLVLRHGLRTRLHINLGIPGIEEPEDPIEENAAALYAAIVMQARSLEVILSGELEQAVTAGLISDAALDNLRNEIRISG